MEDTKMNNKEGFTDVIWAIALIVDRTGYILSEDEYLGIYNILEELYEKGKEAGRKGE
jgi:hypothetical protein